MCTLVCSRTRESQVEDEAGVKLELAMSEGSEGGDIKLDQYTKQLRCA